MDMNTHYIPLRVVLFEPRQLGNMEVTYTVALTLATSSSENSFNACEFIL